MDSNFDQNIFLSNSISYHESIVDTGRTLHNKNTQNILDTFYAFAKKTFLIKYISCKMFDHILVVIIQERQLLVAVLRGI